MERLWLAVGAFLIATAIGWDAFRSHGLEKVLTAAAAPDTQDKPPAETPPQNASDATTVNSPSDGAPPPAPETPAVVAQATEAAKNAADAAKKTIKDAVEVEPAVNDHDLETRLDHAVIAGHHIMYQGLALLVLGAVLSARRNFLLHLVAVAVLVGVTMFAGGLILNIFQPNSLPTWVIPSGGMTLIIAWAIGGLLMFFSSRREPDYDPAD